MLSQIEKYYQSTSDLVCVLSKDKEFSIVWKNKAFRKQNCIYEAFSNIKSLPQKNLVELLEFTLQEVDYGLMYKGEMNIEEIGFTHATIEVFPLDNPTNNELVYLCKITKCDKDLLDSFTQIEQKLNELMEVLSDGVVIHENGTITDANSAFLKLLGYSKDDTIGKPISKFTNAEGMQLIVEKIAENNEDPYRVNGLHKNGSLIPVELVGKAVVVNGLCQRIVVIKALNKD